MIGRKVRIIKGPLKGVIATVVRVENGICTLRLRHGSAPVRFLTLTKEVEAIDNRKERF